jgi:hypothetical protein
MQLMAKIRNMLWPEIADERSASTAIQRAAKWVFAWSFLLIAIGLLDLLVSLVLVAKSPSGISVATEFVWYTIGAGLMFGIIGWRIRKMSLGWAIAGLLICVIGALAVLPSPFGFVINIFLVLIFANAVRATYKYKHIALPAQ